MFKTVSWLLAGALLTYATASTAEEHVLLDESNPPFMYKSNDQPAGVYDALIAAAFKKAGVDAGIATAPWKRAIAEIESGDSAVGGIYKNAERMKKYDYSDKLFDEVIVVYAPKGKSFTFAGVDSLKGKTVGVNRGWSYGDDFDAAAKAGAIKTVENTGDALNFGMLALGRLDAVLAVKESAASVVAAQKLGDKVQMLDKPLSTSPSFVAFNKHANKADVLAKFNAALSAMHQDGSFDALVSSALAQ